MGHRTHCRSCISPMMIDMLVGVILPTLAVRTSRSPSLCSLPVLFPFLYIWLFIISSLPPMSSSTGIYLDRQFLLHKEAKDHLRTHTHYSSHTNCLSIPLASLTFSMDVVSLLRAKITPCQILL